ncbi:phytanoyl-CoA dioxygenase family protein [Streptomyces sp. NPDC058239]|uniref:phytanoyl-CoA dioxygenase family protein n=1 Tax=unclassified Streptomyces TaxID=2593676 RepID=UPI003655A428
MSDHGVGTSLDTSARGTRAGDDPLRAGGLAERAAEFQEHGFTCVRGLLDNDEIIQYREAAVAAGERYGRQSGPGSGYLVSTNNRWQEKENLSGLALHPRITAAAEKLAGMPLRIWEGQVLIKRPGESGPTMWHDDLTFAPVSAPLDSRVTLNAWIALVDVPVERGCLTFLPGSHRRSAPDRVDLAKALEDPESYLFVNWPQLERSPRVTVPLRAGDVTFHHNRIGHASGANSTDSTRISFFVTFTDAEATYRPVPGGTELNLEPGSPLPDDLYPRVNPRPVHGC